MNNVKVIPVLYNKQSKKSLNIFDYVSVKMISASRPAAPLASRCYSHGKVETDEEFDARWVTYFNKPDIDAWELKKGYFGLDCLVYHSFDETDGQR